MKFIPLTLLFLATFSFSADQVDIGCGLQDANTGLIYDKFPSVNAQGATVKFSFDEKQDLYRYDIYPSSQVNVYSYDRIYNNLEITGAPGFSPQTFYISSCRTYSSVVYILKVIPIDAQRSTYIVDIHKEKGGFQRCDLGYDLANHQCAQDCEHITDKKMRFECACAKKFEGAVHTGTFSDDPATCKGKDINYTPKCCFGCKMKDGTYFNIVVDAAHPYADYGCNYDETDHLYLDNPKPPKPDDDNKTKPGKPDNNNTKPDNPDKPDNPNPGGGGGGDKPDKPKPDKPDQPDDPNKDKNGTHPGGGGGGKPGDKDDDKSGTAPDISSDLEKGINDSAKSFDSAYGDYKSKFDGLVSDIKGVIGKIKNDGFIKLGKGREVSCPVTSQTIDFKYFKTSFTYDWCEFLSRFYYVFYFLSLCTCLFFGLKFILVHTFHIGGGSE
mgnify:CR=1 FL=1